VRPGDLISEVLVDRGANVFDFARAVGLTVVDTRALLWGKGRVDARLARALAKHLGGTPGEWHRLQARWDLAQLPPCPRRYSWDRIDPIIERLP
jgi:plasmid maintenance system antidote protein VapI